MLCTFTDRFVCRCRVWLCCGLQIEVRVGISFVDQAHAKLNYANQIGDMTFDQALAKTSSVWDTELSRLTVTGVSDDEMVPPVRCVSSPICCSCSDSVCMKCDGSRALEALFLSAFMWCGPCFNVLCLCRAACG